MFNSKAFCVIILLTTLVLGAAVYLQVQEMMEYKLLTKLKTEYLSGILGSDDAAEPAEDEGSAKKDDKK